MFFSTSNSSRGCCSNSYQVIDDPGTLVVTVAEIKEHLKITTAVEPDPFFQSLIRAATLEVEKYTRRDLITKTFKTYRDTFPYCNSGIILERSKFQSLESFKYLVDNVLKTVDSSIYYPTDETDFSGIYLVDNAIWPSNIDNRLQAIEIEFKAGYGTTAADVPVDIKQVIKMIVACLYENRGDCNEGKSGMNCLGSKEYAILYKYKILDITT